MSDAPPGRTIDLGLPNQKLLICIGEAFQAYAGLEMGLCMLLLTSWEPPLTPLASFFTGLSTRGLGQQY
jgi:hypothetical protein